MSNSRTAREPRADHALELVMTHSIPNFGVTWTNPVICNRNIFNVNIDVEKPGGLMGSALDSGGRAGRGHCVVFLRSI